MKARMLVAVSDKVRKGDQPPAHLAAKYVRVGLAEEIKPEPAAGKPAAKKAKARK